MDDVYGYREGCVLVIYVKITLKFKQSCNKSTGILPLKGFVSLAKSRIHRSVCSSSSSVSIAIKGMPACGVPAGWSSDRASLHVGMRASPSWNCRSDPRSTRRQTTACTSEVKLLVVFRKIEWTDERVDVCAHGWLSRPAMDAMRYKAIHLYYPVTHLIRIVAAANDHYIVQVRPKHPCVCVQGNSAKCLIPRIF